MDDNLSPEDKTKLESSEESWQGHVSQREQMWQVMKKDLDVYFKKGLFILVGVFIVLAAFGLYFSINDIINAWIMEQYIPIVQTIYYIAVIVLCLYFIKLLKDR